MQSNCRKNSFCIRFSYINYSNIAARLLRKALKPELRVEAAKRDVSNIKFTPWANGKPVRKFPIPSLKIDSKQGISNLSETPLS